VLVQIAALGESLPAIRFVAHERLLAWNNHFNNGFYISSKTWDGEGGGKKVLNLCGLADVE